MYLHMHVERVMGDKCIAYLKIYSKRWGVLCLLNILNQFSGKFGLFKAL